MRNEKLRKDLEISTINGEFIIRLWKAVGRIEQDRRIQDEKIQDGRTYRTKRKCEQYRNSLGKLQSRI